MPRKAAAKPAPLVRDNSKLQWAFLICHSRGHSWFHHDGVIDPHEAEAGLRAPSWERTARGLRSNCTVCRADRVQWVTRSGEIVNRYKHTDGYLHNKKLDDEPAPSRREWRVQLATRMFDDEVPVPRHRASRQTD